MDDSVDLRKADPAPDSQVRLRAETALLFVTLLWGLTFPLIRRATQDIDAHAFVVSRFGLAALLLLPLALYRRALALDRWRDGVMLGLLAYFSYLAQTLGMSLEVGSVTSSRAAFITATSVIMVPMLAPLFRAGRPTRVDGVSIGLAMIGLFWLCDLGETSLLPGDWLILGCAFSYAIYIHWLQILLARGHHHVSLLLQQVFAITVFASIGLFFFGEPGADGYLADFTPASLGGIAFCAFFATVVSFWLQARYQGGTTPHRTAIIFTMEPVFAAIFSFLILRETMSAMAIAGAVLILIASVLPMAPQPARKT